MHVSSCGSPCLILHACRECHNTFTSHGSTSSQGQAREEHCLCVSAFANSCTAAPCICMFADRTICRYNQCAYSFTYGLVNIYSRTNHCTSPLEVWCWRHSDRKPDWANRLTLINRSSMHSVHSRHRRVNQHGTKHLTYPKGQPKVRSSKRRQKKLEQAGLFSLSILQAPLTLDIITLLNVKLYWFIVKLLKVCINCSMWVIIGRSQVFSLTFDGWMKKGVSYLNTKCLKCSWVHCDKMKTLLFCDFF